MGGGNSEEQKNHVYQLDVCEIPNCRDFGQDRLRLLEIPTLRHKGTDSLRIVSTIIGLDYYRVDSKSNCALIPKIRILIFQSYPISPKDLPHTSNTNRSPKNDRITLFTQLHGSATIGWVDLVFVTQRD